MSTRYPSKQDIARRMQPVLDELRAQTLLAEYEQPSSPAIDYHAVVGERQVAAPPPPAARVPSGLLSEHIALLQDIAHYPQDGLAARYSRLGISREKGNRLVGDLKLAGCIVVKRAQTATKTGGRPPLIASLILAGEQLLKSKASHA